MHVRILQNPTTREKNGGKKKNNPPLKTAPFLSMGELYVPAVDFFPGTFVRSCLYDKNFYCAIFTAVECFMIT